MTFTNLGLNKPLLAAVSNLGYVKPTQIQKEAIPVMLSGADIIGIAKTGTGKTAAFALPILQNINAASRSVQTLILAPTRELAIQSAQAIQTIAEDPASNMSGIKIAVIYGGAPYPAQLKSLKDGAQIVVATPGRLIDMLNRKALKLDEVSIVVLDEADEMLKMGFQEDIETIFEHTDSDQRQTALFSATMPSAILKIAAKYMHHPKTVQISSPTSTVDNIRQEYCIVSGRGKTSAVHRFYLSSGAQAAIVFTRTRSSAEIVGVELASLGLRTATISGDVAQKERERIVERMKSGKIQVLVATDVAARGLDVEVVELVINYDLPDEPESYIHRIGRTGRAGRLGRSVSFATDKQMRKIKQIEKLTSAKIAEISVPDLAEVRHLEAAKMLEKVAARVELGKLKQYSSAVAHFVSQIKTEGELVEFLSAFIAINVGDDGITHHREHKDDFDEDDDNKRSSRRQDRGRSRGRKDGGSSYGGSRRGDRGEKSKSRAGKRGNFEASGGKKKRDFGSKSKFKKGGKSRRG